MTPEARLRNIVETAAQAVTDDDGRFTVEAFREELIDRLEDSDPHVRLILKEKQIKSLVSGFRRGRQPKVRDGQIEFSPCAVLPVEPGVSVWMGKATPDDVRAWLRIDLDNVAAVVEKSRIKQDYGSSRLDAWQANPSAGLLDLERQSFGWEPGPDDLEWGPDGTSLDD